MKVCIYRDKTIDLKIEDIVSNLNRLAPSLHFHKGNTEFSLSDLIVSAPQTYLQIDKDIHRETFDDDVVLLFTEKRYDNNFFFESEGKMVIVSLSGWSRLTKLSQNNGAVYFACAILVRGFPFGDTHKVNTGCINDYWQDKRGVDIGMRSAFVCPRCLQKFRERATHQQEKMLHEVEAILNDLSAASRSNLDVCDFWGPRKDGGAFDVFLCHNSQEKEAIRDMNVRLKGSGIKTWLDEEQLTPGRLSQDGLEEQIPQIRTVAVFVGDSGIGPWQNVEVKAFLREFVRRGCPVIPVILSSCKTVPDLPLFLSQFTWVDFRKPIPDPYNQLLWGITGKKP